MPTHSRTDDQVLAVLRALTADPRNRVVLFSGRTKAELTEWFASVVSQPSNQGLSWYLV